jgi:hypothetical protein
MKLLLCAAPLLLWPLGSLEAAAPAATACNVMVSVIDPDPAGTNVRKAPGGAVAATLRAPRTGDDWIEVHVVGQAGDWFAIDRADLVGDARKTIFRGSGYMHRSVLGSDGLVNGEPIRADHDERAAQILAGEIGDQPAYLLGCAGDFVKIRIKSGVGWTKTLCLNQRTTCA